MKIAVLSDIHGNIAALKAVFGDIKKRGVDQIVNLGDILSGALFPSETADLLMSMYLPTIKGNHERQILTQTFAKMGLSDQHAASLLSAQQLEWIASLPATLQLNEDVLLVHGTADSDLQYFLETVTVAGVRAATEDEIGERMGEIEARVIVCGHTHIPRIYSHSNGCLIVNPGSVGLPAYDDIHPFPHDIETGSPHARYAIIEKSDDTWSAQLINVEYDWEKAAKTAQANGRDDWARALRTGRV